MKTARTRNLKRIISIALIFSLSGITNFTPVGAMFTLNGVSEKNGGEGTPSSFTLPQPYGSSAQPSAAAEGAATVDFGLGGNGSDTEDEFSSDKPDLNEGSTNYDNAACASAAAESIPVVRRDVNEAAVNHVNPDSMSGQKCICPMVPSTEVVKPLKRLETYIHILSWFQKRDVRRVMLGLGFGKIKICNTRREIPLTECIPFYDGDSVLHCAARVGCKELLDAVFGKFPNMDRNLTNRFDETPLFYAVKSGEPVIVRTLLNKGARLDIGINKNSNLLNWADHIQEMVKILDAKMPPAKKKCVPCPRRCAQVDNISTFMIYTQYVSSYESVETFLDNNPDEVNLVNAMGNSLLHYAVRLGKKNIVKLLLERGALVNIQNVFGETPLHFAILNNDLEIARMLREAGARVDIPDDRGVTLLQLREKYIEIANILKEHARLNPDSAAGLSAAAEPRPRDAATVDSDFGVNGDDDEEEFPANAPDNKRRRLEDSDEVSANHDSCVSVSESALRPLSDSLHVCLSKNDFVMAMHLALTNNNIMLVKLLGGYVKDVNDVVDCEGNTYLHHAVCLRNENFVKFLLEKGAKVNVVNNKNETPLYIAIQLGGMPKIAGLLLEKGAKMQIH